MKFQATRSADSWQYAQGAGHNKGFGTHVKEGVKGEEGTKDRLTSKTNVYLENMVYWMSY